MKNIIRLFAIGAVAFTGVSCEDFLSADPVNRVSAEAFLFRNPIYSYIVTVSSNRIARRRIRLVWEIVIQT